MIFLQRAKFKIPGAGGNTINVPSYRMANDAAMDADDEMLRCACRDLQADVFISTYFTRAPGVTNVVMVHDLIPEKFNFDLTQPEWESKRRAIETADAFICVSKTTQQDLVEIYPQTRKRPMGGGSPRN